MKVPRYVKDSLVRAAKTVAQATIAMIGTTAVGITDVAWIGVASAAALAGVLSLLFSVAYAPSSSNEWEGTPGSSE